MFGFVVRESRSSDVVSKEPIQTSQMDQETLPSPSPSGKPGADTLKTLRSERVSQAMDCANPLQSSSDEKMLVDDVGSQLTLDTDTSRLAVSEVPDIVGAQDTPSSSSQPDEGDPQPESIFKQCFTTPPEVVKDITNTNNRKYLLKSRFGVQNMHRIAHLYVLAVYDHADQGTAMQTKQVFAILFHELDHQWTTDDQRSYYHQYCGSWCRFRKWIKDGESAGSYSHVDSSWVEDKNKAWKQGIFAGIDTLYPNAFRELVAKFRILGKQDLMDRCSIPVTTNMCESIHARLVDIVSKDKAHSLARIMFAAKQVMLTSVLGLLKSNLDCVFGTISNLAEHDTVISQRHCHRVARRRHVTSSTVKDGTRRKVSSVLTSDRRKSRPLPETLVPSGAKCSYVGGGLAD